MKINNVYVGNNLEVLKTIIKESIKEDKEKELGIMDIFDFMGEENE